MTTLLPPRDLPSSSDSSPSKKLTLLDLNLTSTGPRPRDVNTWLPRCVTSHPLRRRMLMECWMDLFETFAAFYNYVNHDDDDDVGVDDDMICWLWKWKMLLRWPQPNPNTNTNCNPNYKPQFWPQWRTKAGAARVVRPGWKVSKGGILRGYVHNKNKKKTTVSLSHTVKSTWW